MFVETELLRQGANESHRAGGHARDGADRLTHAPLMSGMFGDFAAAGAFHAALIAARDQHAEALQAHQQALTAVGTKAHCAVGAFTEMDQHNAAELRAVRCNSAT